MIENDIFKDLERELVEDCPTVEIGGNTYLLTNLSISQAQYSGRLALEKARQDIEPDVPEIPLDKKEWKEAQGEDAEGSVSWAQIASVYGFPDPKTKHDMSVILAAAETAPLVMVVLAICTMDGTPVFTTKADIFRGVTMISRDSKLKNRLKEIKQDREKKSIPANSLPTSAGVQTAPLEA